MLRRGYTTGGYIEVAVGNGYNISIGVAIAFRCFGLFIYFRTDRRRQPTICKPAYGIYISLAIGDIDVGQGQDVFIGTGQVHAIAPIDFYAIIPRLPTGIRADDNVI